MRNICLQGRDKEIAKLEARATSAEGLLAEAKQKGEVEKGGALSSALAAARKASDERESELRKAMREGESKLKERVERLENDNASLRRSDSSFPQVTVVKKGSTLVQMSVSSCFGELKCLLESLGKQTFVMDSRKTFGLYEP